MVLKLHLSYHISFVRFLFVWLEAALIRFIGQSQFGRWCGLAGGAVKHDLHPVHNAPGAGEAVPADVVLLGQILEIDLGVVAQALAALLDGRRLAELLVDGREQNLSALQTVVCVLHALNAGQQVVLQHDDGGCVVQARPGQRRVGFKVYIQQVHINQRDLPLAGRILEQRRRVDEEVRLDLPPVEHGVHPVHRQEILRERQALQVLPFLDKVGGGLLGA